MRHIKDDNDILNKVSLSKKLKQAEKTARSLAMKNRIPFEGLQIKPTASFYDDAPTQEPGQNNWNKFGFDIHPHVTVVSTIFLAIFICLNLMFHEQAAEFFSATLKYITTKTGWFFILTVNVIIVACLYFCFSRFGKIRIGGQKARPEFSTFAWFSMLLSAGMGIGLMFWSVGEPIFHLSSPSPMFSGILPGTAEAA